MSAEQLRRSDEAQMTDNKKKRKGQVRPMSLVFAMTHHALGHEDGLDIEPQNLLEVKLPEECVRLDLVTVTLSVTDGNGRRLHLLLLKQTLTGPLPRRLSGSFCSSAAIISRALGLKTGGYLWD